MMYIPLPAIALINLSTA